MLDKTLIGWFPFDVTTRTQKVLEVCYNLIILFIGEVFDDFFLIWTQILSERLWSGTLWVSQHWKSNRNKSSSIKAEQYFCHSFSTFCEQFNNSNKANMQNNSFMILLQQHKKCCQNIEEFCNDCHCADGWFIACKKSCKDKFIEPGLDFWGWWMILSGPWRSVITYTCLGCMLARMRPIVLHTIV